MFFKNNFLFAVLVSFQQILILAASPFKGDPILKGVDTIHNTTKNIFSSLGVNITSEKSKLRDYTVVHNFFLSLTSKDHDTLKEISKTTRIDKENSTKDFIDVINNIFEEEREKITKNIEHAVKFNFDDELAKIEYLKKYYDELENKSMTVNKEVLKILEVDNVEHDVNFSTVTPESTTANHSDDIEFWHEEDEEELEIQSGRRVFSGKFTKAKYFPFMVSIQMFNKFQCAGSIIKSDLVITAASCLQIAWNNRFYRENPSFLSVRIGSSFYEAGGDVIGVLEIFFYPNYNPKNLFHNIAIMRLMRNIKFLHKKFGVKKIALDKSPEHLPSNVRSITIVGWGSRVRNNRIYNAFDNKMSFANLSMYPLIDCQDIYSKAFVTDHHFCAGYISKGDGACHKDVGGPGIVTGVLAGVISFGAPVCGTADAPTVFTKVGYYYDWIEDIMEQEVPYVFQRTTTKRPRTEYYLTQFTFSEPGENKTSIDVPETFLSKPVVARHMNKKVLKEFLRTMFESSEIQEYFDAQDAVETTEKPSSHNTETYTTTTQIPTFHSSETYEPKNAYRTYKPTIDNRHNYIIENINPHQTVIDNVEPIATTVKSDDEGDPILDNVTGVMRTSASTPPSTDIMELFYLDKLANDADNEQKAIVDVSEETVDPDQDLVDTIIKFASQTSEATIQSEPDRSLLRTVSETSSASPPLQTAGMYDMPKRTRKRRILPSKKYHNYGNTARPKYDNQIDSRFYRNKDTEKKDLYLTDEGNDMGLDTENAADFLHQTENDFMANPQFEDNDKNFYKLANPTASENEIQPVTAALSQIESARKVENAAVDIIQELVRNDVENNASNVISKDEVYYVLQEVIKDGTQMTDAPFQDDQPHTEMGLEDFEASVGIRSNNIRSEISDEHFYHPFTKPILESQHNKYVENIQT